MKKLALLVVLLAATWTTLGCKPKESAPAGGGATEAPAEGGATEAPAEGGEQK